MGAADDIFGALAYIAGRLAVGVVTSGGGLAGAVVVLAIFVAIVVIVALARKPGSKARSDDE